MFLAKQGDEVQIAAAMIIFGGVLVFNSLKNIIRSRKIEDTARIDIGSAPQGLVEIEGFAWPKTPPIECARKRKVIYYNYKVQKYVKRGKSSHWDTVHEFTYDQPFYVLDPSGACVVNPLKPTLEVTERISSLSGHATEISDLSSKLSSTGFFSISFGGRYRLVERKILAGAPVYIRGEMRPSAESQHTILGNYQKFLERVKKLKINKQFFLDQIDSNRDGEITDDELIHGFSSAAAGAIKEAAIQSQVKISGVITHSEQHELILSDCHQDRLLKRLKSYVYMKLTAGIALIGGGVYVIQIFLKWK